MILHRRTPTPGVPVRGAVRPRRRDPVVVLLGVLLLAGAAAGGFYLLYPRLGRRLPPPPPPPQELAAPTSSVERFIAILSGTDTRPRARAFAAEFYARPELRAIWDEYQTTGDGERLTLQLEQSASFAALLLRFKGLEEPEPDAPRR